MTSLISLYFIFNKKLSTISYFKTLINENQYKIKKIYSIIVILIQFINNFIIFYSQKISKYKIMYNLFYIEINIKPINYNSSKYKVNMKTKKNL